MDPIDALEEAWGQGGDVLATLRPDQLDDPTPCAEFDVRAVVNHVLGEALMMSDANRRQSASSDRGDLIGPGDARTTWESIGRDNVTSWREGGLDGDRAYVYGTFPASVGVVINLSEVLVHTWDLARATGRSLELDPDLSAIVFGLYGTMPLDGLRAEGVFGPEIQVDAEATVADRLLGLLGRRP